MTFTQCLPDRPRRCLSPLMGALWLAGAVAVAQTEPADEPPPTVLAPVRVVDGADADDWEVPGDQFQRALEAPFGNPLLWDVAAEDFPEDYTGEELDALIAAWPPPALVAAGADPFSVAGYPMTLRRNDRTSFGVSDILGVDRTLRIQGSLVPVYGRAVPGGIRDLRPALPTARSVTRMEASVDTREIWRARVRRDEVLTPRRTWLLFQVEERGRDGPQDFADSRQTTLRTAVRHRHTNNLTSIWSLDYLNERGNAAPGLIEFREAAGQPILGPYLPLAGFNAFGPNGARDREVLALGLEFENRFQPDLSLRSATYLTASSLVQDTFTVGQYNLATGLLTGTRAPRRNETDVRGLNHETSLQRTFDARFGTHRLRAAVEYSEVSRHRVSRGLSPAAIAALPASARFFDPFDPDYSRPAFSPALYDTFATDLDIDQTMMALGLDARSAFRRGSTVLAAGVQAARSDVQVSDRRPTAPVPFAERDNQTLSPHVAINQIVGRHLLLFANASQATAPITRVDRRTGEIKENARTRGVEAGARVVVLDRRLSLSGLAYQYTNENIPRLNPFLGDPVLDPDQTLPELLSSGEERYRGFSATLGARPSPGWSGQVRATWSEALTVSSPDAPEEEGRQLANRPRFTAAASVSHRPTYDLLRGFTFTLSCVHVGATVRHYERPGRARVDHDAYELVNLGVTRAWQSGRTRQSATLSVTNVFDEDLLAKVSRLGAERAASLTWRIQL